jgi:integrase
LRERRDIGRALLPEQEQRLLASCAIPESACYTAAVLALNTAMRKEEIRKLSWADIPFAAGQSLGVLAE